MSRLIHITGAEQIENVANLICIYAKIGGSVIERGYLEVNTIHSLPYCSKFGPYYYSIGRICERGLKTNV